MPTQRLLTGAEYIAFTDDYSSAIKAVLAISGDEDAAGTAAHYSSHVRDAVTALDQPDEAQLTADLIDAAIAVVAAWNGESTLAARFAQFNSNVRSHIGTDISTWLTSEAAGRVSHYWRRGGDTSIAAANVFPPETILGTVAVTGSGANTLTAGTPVASIYGGAQVAVRVTGQSVGIANIGVTLTGLDASGTSRTWTATISSGDTVGTVVNCAGTGVTTGMSVSACATTLGTNGDDFEIITIEDRTIT